MKTRIIFYFLFILLLVVGLFPLWACSDSNQAPDSNTQEDADLSQQDSDSDESTHPDGDQDEPTDGGIEDTDQPVDSSDTDLLQDADEDEDIDYSLCESFAEGWNEGFLVDGEPRSFVLDLPETIESEGPWPVIFVWHGLGQSAEWASGLIEPLVNNEVMPFIGVVPEDTDYEILSYSLDWDVIVVREDNREARLFDEILNCLEYLYDVDENHIHSAGGSMGGFVTDMLGTIRGEQIASMVSFSGGYGNNPENIDGKLSFVVDWPDFEVENKYVQLLAHGGDGDVLFVDFQAMSINDADFLNEHGHDVFLCNHGLGHVVPSDLISISIIEFFAQHPHGTETSPWSTGFPSEFPDYCVYRPASSE